MRDLLSPAGPTCFYYMYVTLIIVTKIAFMIHFRLSLLQWMS